MKRLTLAILVILIATTAMASRGPKLGGGMGFGLVGDEAGFQMSFEALVPIYQQLYVKTSLLRLWVGDITEFGLGPGTASYSLPAVFIQYYIPMNQVEPYIGVGLNINSRSDEESGASGNMTTMSFMVGGGAEYKLQGSPLILFGEMALGVASISQSWEYAGVSQEDSNSDMLFGILMGMRFEM